jgi:serine/threonine-protein kinase RsbW
MSIVREDEPAVYSWCGLRQWWTGGVRSTTELSEPLQAIEAAMIAARFPAKDVFAVRLVLEEALVNAIHHGHRDDATKVVRLRCWGSDDEVVATVKDEGDGFCLTSLPDPRAEDSLHQPSGRGLLLMMAYATYLLFNSRGNGLIFRRRRSAD